MKKIIGSILVVVLVLLNSSCNDSCDEGNKPTPASFFVNIVDEVSGVNVFENETYTFQQITVTDLNDVAIPYKFITSANLIQIFPLDINPTGNTLRIKLNNETTLQMDEIDVNFDVSSSAGECFTTYKIENILFPNNTSEFVEGVFVIKI
ncbi:hypothetical protein [Flavobacterium sp.]|jgi:hypothetical protein|uniref:hypothetical protein n=1 Tax=Flavobacterium sp. TaxID=239 RepID=UPI0037C0E968